MRTYIKGTNYYIPYLLNVGGIDVCVYMFNSIGEPVFYKVDSIEIVNNNYEITINRNSDLPCGGLPHRNEMLKAMMSS